MYNFNILKNGLSLITVPMSGTKTVTALIVVGTGSKYEAKNKSGISHFLEHMFFKGTFKRPTSFAITSVIDGIGAEFNAFTSKEYTGYYIKTEPKQLAIALDVLSDMLLNSKFDEKDINMEKGVIIEELNMYLDNPMMFIEDVFEQCLYGDTPAGRDTIGTRAAIAGMKRSDFINYLNSQYTASNTVICLAGNLKRIDVETGQCLFSADAIDHFFAKKEFNARGQDFQEKEPVAESQNKPQVKLHFKKTDQAHLSLGVRTFGYNHKDKTIIKLISILLGGSMSSRLFVALREKNGLAYYVRSEEERYTDSGYLTTRAGVPVDKINLAIKLILSEYDNLKNKLVASKELQRVKDLIRGRFTIQLESSDNVANWYTRQAVLFQTLAREEKKHNGNVLKQIISPDNFLNEIDKVSSADIKRVANDIFMNSRLNLAMIGPYEAGEKFMNLLRI